MNLTDKEQEIFNRLKPLIPITDANRDQISLSTEEWEAYTSLTLKVLNEYADAVNGIGNDNIWDEIAISLKGLTDESPNSSINDFTNRCFKAIAQHFYYKGLMHRKASETTYTLQELRRGISAGLSVGYSPEYNGDTREAEIESILTIINTK